MNEVQYEYNGWGEVYREYQEHDGAVDANTLFVQYDYQDGGTAGIAKYVRLEQVTYPNGREVQYGYGTTGAIDDIMSRLATIGDGANTHAAYAYLGVGMIVVEDYVQPQTRLTYLDGSGTVTGLDRFGRVVDQVWEDYGANPDVPIDRYTYTYDRAGNRTGRDNEVGSALDEDYLYDDIDRLVEWKVNNVSQKTWTLDSLGNNLGNQNENTYNAANEETPGQGYSGYDAAGNMTTLQSGKTAAYDAWNRLVEVDDGETIIQRNEYDGANRRIQIFSDFDGSTPDKVVDDYLSGQQVIESDVTVDATRDGGYQYIWSPRYIDAAVLRDTLTTAGTGIVAAQRVFYLSDANYNVTGLVKYDSGASEWKAAERFTYTPYGLVTYRNPDWSTAGSSANSNTILYTGRTLDLPTSLYYYRARYYDASLERFINRDPIGYRGGINLYEYAGDNPVRRTDPAGKNPAVIVVPVVGGAVVITAAEAAAAAFGMSMAACLGYQPCRDAMIAAIQDAVNALGDAMLAVLRANCAAQYTLYKAAESLCGKCDRGRARTLEGRLCRCSAAVAYGACWTAVAALRGAYVLSGCDFIMAENKFDTHVKEVQKALGAAANCTLSVRRNCLVW